MNPIYQLKRLPEVMTITALGRSSIYNHVNEGLLPPPISLGGRCVAWPLHELEKINAAKIAGKNEEEIKQLVSELISQRQGDAA